MLFRSPERCKPVCACFDDLTLILASQIGLSAIVGNYSQTRSALCTQSKANSTFCITKWVVSLHSFKKLAHSLI